MEDRMDLALSVIIPVYNVEEYLPQCLDSVLGQLEDEDEVILIDDGSTDKSSDLCRDYLNKNARIKFIHQENSGLGKTRNVGLLQASNPNVIFLDSDDFWAEDTVKTIKNALSREYIDILYFDAKKIYEGNIEETENQYDRKKIVSTERLSGQQFFEKYYPDGYVVQACMAVYKRDFLLENKIIFQEGVYYEDNIFSFQAVMNARKVKYIPYQLYMRRVHENSIMTSGMSYRKLYDYTCVVQLIWDYVKMIFPKLSGKLRLQVIRYADARLYTFREMCRGAIIGGWERQIYLLRVKVFEQYIALLKRYGEDLEAFQILKLKGLGGGRPEEDSAIEEAFGGKEEFEQILVFSKQKYEKRIREKVMALPIAEPECKIGIYGIGIQTERFIQFCNKIGIETKNIIYIDSYEPSGKRRFHGCEVKNVRDVGNSVNKVIISSSLYRDEMYQMAKRFLPEDTEIAFLYEPDEEDIFWDML